jgi:hypothetical protein
MARNNKDKLKQQRRAIVSFVCWLLMIFLEQSLMWQVMKVPKREQEPLLVERLYYQRYISHYFVEFVAWLFCLLTLISLQ